MVEATPDFAALLEQARAGDADALAELAQMYEPEVRIMAHVLLGPALRPYLDSVDIVQSVHKSLALGLRNKKFDISSPEKLQALAVEMVRRKVGRHWRHLQRQQRLSRGPADSPDLALLLTSLGSRHEDPVQAAQHKEQVQQVCRSLDPTERRLVEMRLQGYSTVEAAREMGLDPDVLRVRLSRMRQRLRAGGLDVDLL